jgi:type IV pilus assembly protein PilP
MKRNLNNSIVWGAIFLLAGLPVGCKKNEQPAPAPEQKKEQPKNGQPAAPVQKPMSSAGAQAPTRLDFTRKVDPFKPFAPAVAPPQPGVPVAQAPPRPTGDQLPIQSFEVGKFKLVGIIAGINQNRALLIDPAGKGYVVQEGMEIGTHEGRITKITSSSVEVIESFKADNGRIKKRKIVLTLAKKR